MRPVVRSACSLLLLAFLVQCAGLGPAPTIPDYTVQTVTASCQSRALPRADVQVTGRTVVITEVIQTPNPCYEIVANVELRDDELFVNFFPESRSGMCIQCLGELVGNVTIHDLAAGEYTLIVQTRQRMTRTTITISE